MKFDPNSPITASDNAVLSGTGEVGVEAEMATLRLILPQKGMKTVKGSLRLGDLHVSTSLHHLSP